MANSKLYKYINLLVRLLIGLGALYFIYYKLKDNLEWNLISAKKIDFTIILLVFILMLFNWGVEAYKWRYAIRKIELISLKKAFFITLAGVTGGLITPNRIGEVPFRVMLLSKDNFKGLASKTIVSSYSQLLATVLFGTASIAIVGSYFDFEVNSFIVLICVVVLSLLMIVVYFNANLLGTILLMPFIKKDKLRKALLNFSTNELINLFLMSTLRYMIFSLQYYLMLYAFGIELKGIYELLLIPLCFMIASIIPSILISEIGVRGSVSLLIFGVVSNQSVAIVAASIALWGINVAVPALLGLYNLKEFKVIRIKN